MGRGRRPSVDVLALASPDAAAGVELSWLLEKVRISICAKNNMASLPVSRSKMASHWVFSQGTQCFPCTSLGET